MGENITVENVRKEKETLRRNFGLIIQYRIKKVHQRMKNFSRKYGVDLKKKIKIKID
jgi:hypothetical protein